MLIAPQVLSVDSRSVWSSVGPHGSPLPRWDAAATAAAAADVDCGGAAEDAVVRSPVLLAMEVGLALGEVVRGFESPFR